MANNNHIDISIVEQPNIVIDIGYSDGAPGKDGENGRDSWISESIESDDIILKGQPIYIKQSGHCSLANANSFASSNVIGLANNDTEIGHVCHYTKTDMELDDWTDIVGTQYLIPGVLYFLSDISGKLTITPNQSLSKYIIYVGKAVSTKILDINIGTNILL
jgi:hypothetical protein